MAHNYSGKRRPRVPLPHRQKRELAHYLAFLAAASAHQEKPDSRLSRALDWASEHFNLLASAAVLLTFLGACALYQVNPLHPLRKFKHEQDEYNQQEAKRDQDKARQQFIKTVAETRLQMGRKLLNESFYGDAKKEFAKALDLDKKSLPAELGILKCEVYELGEYRPALIEKRIQVIEEYFKKLETSKACKDPHILVFWGDLHYREGDIDQAIEDFRSAVKNDDDVAGAHFKLGYLYEKKSEDLVVNDGTRAKDLKILALEEYKKAVEKSKWNHIYYHNLASQYAQLKDRGNAIISYKKVIRLAPDFILPYLELSDVFRQYGNLKDAYAYLHDAVIMLEDQRVAASLKNQGGWVFDCDRVPNSVTLYEVPEKQAYAYLSMSLTLHLLNKQQEALNYVEKARNLKLRTISTVLSVVRQDHSRLPDQSKKKSDFLATLDREIPTSE